MAASTSKQSNGHQEIFNIISNKQNEELCDDDYERIKTISKNCDVNARLSNCNNETLMHLAIREQNEKLIKIINDHGGDFFVRNLFNQTPRDIAIELKYLNIIKFIDENETIRFENDEIFEKISNIKCKIIVKSIRLIDGNEFKKYFSNHNDSRYCKTFPNLFAFKIATESENKQKLIDEIFAQFNDGRPLLVFFQSKPSCIYYKRENSDKFKLANAEKSEEIQNILNNKNIPISLIEKYCKSNDSLMIRVLKLRKSSNDFKIIESVLKLSDNLEIIQAVIFEPFTRLMFHFIDIEEMICHSYDKNILELAIKHEKVEFINYLIENYKYYLKNSRFCVKELLVEFIANENQENLKLLIESDFPFPQNVDNLNENIQKIILDREIFKSNNLEEIKKYLNENKLMRIGYDSQNKSALLYAIENKMFDIYSYLLSVGFRTDLTSEIRQKIDNFSDKELEVIRNKNLEFAHSDGKNHLRLLTNKFGVFSCYQYEEHFDVIYKILEELNGIDKCKPILRFCADVEMLKVTLDFESENIHNIHPPSKSTGGTCSNCLVFVAGKRSSDELKKTIIHELCHCAMSQFYENNFNPYYLNDHVNSSKFQKITENILNKLDSGEIVDIGDGIISNIHLYDEIDYQNEMIVRAFEIIVHYDGDEEKIKKLPSVFAELFNYIDEYVVKALLSEDFKNRAKIRSLNGYIGLLQNIKEANVRQLCENSENDAKLDAIFNKSQNKHFIVSNVPQLALINIENYLTFTQKSLYDAKNIFIDPKQLEIKKKLEKFKKLEETLSSLIIDISNGCKYKSFLDESKLIFVGNKNNFYENQVYLDNYNFEYDKIELNYKWNNLTKESQKKLVEKVNFQGKQFKLSEIIDENLINENIIDDEVFVDLFNENKIIEINSKVNQFDVFVERQFNKLVYERKEQESESEESNSDNLHPFQMVLARHKEKFEKQERVEEAFADSHKDFLNKIENCSKILISDIPGSGKSYILRKISQLLMSQCDNNNNYWVLFVDLRKFLQKFFKWNDQICFLSFFHAHLGRNLQSFEKKIFEILYNCGRVKLLFDGFDEISPKCKDVVIDFIKSIKLNDTSSTSMQKAFNQIFITTRKHLEFELEERLEISEIFSLKSLETDEEMMNILFAYWKLKDIQINNVKVIAKRIIEKFHEIKLNDRNLIGKIQQLKILAEICVQNDESFTNFTMYDIYERSIEQLIDNWKKRPDCKDLVKKVDLSSSPNFVVNHQYRALLESIDKEMVTKFFTHLGKMWNSEEIEKGGLVTIENGKTYFMHTTYLEFFIANLIIQSLDNSVLYSGLLIELFCQIMFVPYLTTTQMFVNDKINSLNLSDEVIDAFCQHFNAKLIDLNILKLSISQNHKNVLNFLLKIIDKVDEEKRKLFFISETEYPLFLSLKYSKINVFNNILRLTTEYITDDEFIELIQKKFKNFTILHLLYVNSITFEMMNSLILSLEEKFDEQKMKNLLLTKGGNWDSLPIQILLVRMNSENLDIFEFIWNYHLKFMTLEELFEKSLNYNGNSILHFIAVNSNMFVHEKLWRQCRIEFQSNKSKLYEFLLQRNNYNNYYLHKLVGAEKSSVEILKFNLNEMTKFFNNVNEIFLSKGENDDTLLQRALIHRKSFEFFKTLWNFIRISCNRDDFVKHINELNSNNMNLFYIALEMTDEENDSKVEIVKFIIDSLENDLKMSPDEIKLFLKPHEKNFLSFIAEKVASIEVHEFLWRVLENIFDANEIFDMINEVNSDGYNLLHTVIISRIENNLNVVEFTWNKIKNYVKNPYEQKKYVEKCAILKDQLSNEKWLMQLLSSYKINLTT